MTAKMGVYCPCSDTGWEPHSQLGRSTECGRFLYREHLLCVPVGVGECV